MVVPKGGGLAPFFPGGCAEKRGLYAMETGYITMTVTWKESVRPVDYGGMERGSQPPLQSPIQGPQQCSQPHGVVGPTVVSMSLALGL